MKQSEPPLDVDVVIVGAGISGVGTAIELLRQGCTSFVLLEAHPDTPGGTWRQNTYPGVAVDIMVVSYCYSYETNYPWSKQYAPGEEILAYIRHCIDKYGVEPYIRYGSRVQSCKLHDNEDQWATHLSDGKILHSRHVVAATGILATPKFPQIPGMSEFRGKSMHTANWDHGLDLSQKRVGIVGTGASSVQVCPAIAPKVAHLTVFQRTPIWVCPGPNWRLNEWSPQRRFAFCRRVLWFVNELAFEVITFVITNYKYFGWLVLLVQRLLKVYMKFQVKDKVLAEKLIPGYTLGCKRPTVNNEYLPTFNRANVSLVTDGISKVCSEGIITADNKLHELDVIVWATGFRTTEKHNMPSFMVFGRNNVELGEFWEDNRFQAYAGVSVPGYPNFWLTAGPYSGGFNWYPMIEAHASLIVHCIKQCTGEITQAEVAIEAHEQYMQYMWSRAAGCVWTSLSCAGSNSYYLDRHGDASLPIPQTPWWRSRWISRGTAKDGFRYSNRNGTHHTVRRREAQLTRTWWHSMLEGYNQSATDSSKKSQ